MSEHFYALTDQDVDRANLSVEPEWLAEADEVGKPKIEVETWREFEQKAGEHIPTLIDGLWPENALGFIAGPPKKGKTWVALTLAIGVCTGSRVLDRFNVHAARPVLYVALEGHRAALRTRVGAIARGMNLDPDSEQLDRLHWTYKPRGINISDPDWAELLRQTAAKIGANFVVVDVLRAGARLKENSSEEFNMLRLNLLPMLDDGHSVALLHHFGKLTELTKERTPGERMSGSGAMYGALDVGVFITGSDEGARKLRLQFELRDLAEPPIMGIHLRGAGTGDNGGFTYTDTARWEREEAPDEQDVKAPAEEIANYVRDNGGDVERRLVEAFFDIADKTLDRRLMRLHNLGIELVRSTGRGHPARLVDKRDPVVQDDQMDLQSVSTITGHDHPTSNTRHVDRSDVSTFTPSNQAKNGERPTIQDIDPVGYSESAYLQEEKRPYRPTLPTGEQAPAKPDALPQNTLPPDDPDADIPL